MMLWFVMALMTAAAIFAALWPLARRTPLRSGSDIAVYRDQLDEIERDRAAGLIGGGEAGGGRVEGSRRGRRAYGGGAAAARGGPHGAAAVAAGRHDRPPAGRRARGVDPAAARR